MTIEEQFRANASARDGLKSFLESDLGRTAMLILKDKQTPGRIPDIASLSPSERQHLYAQNQTFQAGWHECLRSLAMLTVPLPEAKEAPKLPTLQRDYPQASTQTETK